jgi:peptide/nickel transport system substrate-binding protein
MEQASGPDSLDPAYGFTAQDVEAMDQVYQGLVQYAENSTNIVLLLAQSYNISSNGMTYSFILRPNINFSNGDPMNAYCFWYSIYRTAVMDQSPSGLVTTELNTTSITASILNEFNSTNNIPSPSLLQIMENPNNAITVTGEYSIQFHLSMPYSAFLSTLTQPQSFVVDPRVVSTNGGVVTGQTSTYMTFNAIGTGPFMITQFQPSVETIYQRNPTYWGGANGVQPTPRLYEVIARIVPDALTRLKDVQVGEAQMAYVDVTLGKTILTTPGVYVTGISYPVIEWLSMDTQKFPFNETSIRLAVAHSINYTALASLAYGFGETFVGPDAKGLLGYNYTLQPYSYNPSLSMQLLSQAGYPNGKGIPTLTFYYPTDRPPAATFATVIQSDLQQIGIKVSLTGETDSVMDSYLSTTNSTSQPNIMIDSWFFYPDPSGYVDWLVGPLCYGPCNEAWYNNTAVNNLLTQAGATTNQTARGEIYQHIAEIVYNDAPELWLVQYKDATDQGVPVAVNSLRGFIPNFGFPGFDFSTLYLSP